MSKVEIYYFSGTGNSLAVARDLALRLSGRLISIPSVADREQISTNADVIGIVFPVYFASNDEDGVPLIVGRFAGKLEGLGRKYVFAVCTHSGQPGTTLENLANILKSLGGRLAAGYAVKMSNPPSVADKLKAYILSGGPAKAGVQGADERQRKTFAAWKEKLEMICGAVDARTAGRLKTRSLPAKLIHAPLLALLVKPIFRKRYERLAESRGLPFNALIPLSDRSFRTGDRCKGCGTCSQVCPVGNIAMIDNKPVWQHRCENCFACYTWCPQAAIFGEIVAYAERSHHPDIRLADMLRRC